MLPTLTEEEKCTLKIVTLAAYITLKRDLEDTLADPSMLEDRDRFHRLVRQAMNLLALEDDDVADVLPVGRSVVRRWKSGVASPLPMMRKPVYKFLLRKAEAACSSISLNGEGV